MALSLKQCLVTSITVMALTPTTVLCEDHHAMGTPGENGPESNVKKDINFIEHYEVCHEVASSSRTHHSRVAHVISNQNTRGAVLVIIEKEGSVQAELMCGGSMSDLICVTQPYGKGPQKRMDLFSLKQVGSQRVAVYDTVQYFSKRHGTVFYCKSQKAPEPKRYGFAADSR